MQGDKEITIKISADATEINKVLDELESKIDRIIDKFKLLGQLNKTI